MENSGADTPAQPERRHSSPVFEVLRPKPTGATIVVLRDDASFSTMTRKMSETFGAARTAVSTSELASVPVNASEMIVLEDLNAAILPKSPATGTAALGVLAAENEVEEVRPEFYLFVQQEFFDTEEATWGVQAVGASGSPFTGSGIKVAILDTGIDLTHPDFQGRPIVSKSFVTGEGVEDLQGHGTHCAGTAVGSSRQGHVPRFGVAPQAELFVGKVLNNAGTGAERNIVAGMSWAIDSGCEVISMSLGAPVHEGGKPSRIYERIGRRALDNKCLILAAAGNESNRDFSFIAPVGEPANTSTIMAVGAITPNFKPATFSNGGINPDGGDIDLVAPGTNILSTAPMPRRHRTLSGTSMACPHAAGVAALWAQSDASLRGSALWNALTANARRLAGAKRDLGAGLVQAPPAPLA